MQSIAFLVSNQRGIQLACVIPNRFGMVNMQGF